jgi:hypothetical protein
VFFAAIGPRFAGLPVVFAGAVHFLPVCFAARQYVQAWFAGE